MCVCVRVCVRERDHFFLILLNSPQLTWRDVQHIIALTSRSEPMKSVRSSNWHVNGAGHEVSHYYGFGLMDATAIVSRARHWETVPDQVQCTFPYNDRHKRLVVCFIWK